MANNISNPDDALIREKRQQRVAAVQKAVAIHFQVTAEELSHAREPDPTWQQKVAISIAHQVIPLTDDELGKCFGCSSTAVAKSLIDVSREASRDKRLANDISSLMKPLTAERITAHRVSIEDVMRAVATHFQIGYSDLTSQSRERRVARPRQIAMYIAKGLTRRSLPEIGKKFGGRDHTTVLHAIRTVENLCLQDVGINQAIYDLKRTLAPFP